MKKLMFSLGILIVLCAFAQAQPLEELYKKGTVKLVPDPGYATGNNWNEMFSDYHEIWSQHNIEVGKVKKIVVAPDGSVFMSHKNAHEIWKFDASGKLVKKFGEHGGKAHQFPMMPSVHPILDNQYIYTADVNGRVKFFDLEGNYIKQITLDYMPLDVATLSDRKIAIHGYVGWKGPKTRYIVTLVDMNSGESKIIFSQFKDDFGTVSPDKKIQLGIDHNREKLVSNGKDRLYFADPATGLVRVFSNEGKQLESFQLDIQPLKVTSEVIQQYYEAAKARIPEIEKRLQNKQIQMMVTESGVVDKTKEDYMETVRENTEKLKDPANYESTFPYFTSLLVDSDNNILAFQYTREKQTNQFVALTFNNKGEKLATASFSSDQYEFSFVPSAFCFYKGKVIAVCIDKGGGDIPLRLMRFSLK